MELNASVWSSYFYGLSPEEQVLRFLEGGFTHSEFSTEDGDILLSRGQGAVTAFRRFADDNGFYFPQGHLLITADICQEASADVLKQWLDMFDTLGIKAAVLHAAGGIGLSREEQFARRVRTLEVLCAYIKGSDMTICLENLRGDFPVTSQDLFAYIDAVGSEHLGICLDTGHLHVCRDAQGELLQTQRDFILHAGKHLKALHISDNDGLHNQHILPYGCGNIDWVQVMTALKEVGYNGLFNLEIPGESRIPFAVRSEKLKYIKKLCSMMCETV